MYLRDSHAHTWRRRCLSSGDIRGINGFVLRALSCEFASHSWYGRMITLVAQYQVQLSAGLFTFGIFYVGSRVIKFKSSI